MSSPSSTFWQVEGVTWHDILIAILVAVIALGGALIVMPMIVRETKANQAHRSVIKGLEIAIKSYKTEYLRLPQFRLMDQFQSDQTIDTASPDGIALLDMLLGHKTVRNPRAIRFWDAPSPGSIGIAFSSDKGLLDPKTQRGLMMVLDYNSDGLIGDPAGSATPIKADVILFSAGRDGDFSTWEDNVRSWE